MGDCGDGSTWDVNSTHWISYILGMDENTKVFGSVDHSGVSILLDP